MKLFPNGLTVESLRARHGAPTAATAAVAAVARTHTVIPVHALFDWRSSDEAILDDANFRLDDKKIAADTLFELNKLPRCSRIQFREDTHEYFVDGQRAPWSGTTFSHYCERAFDADAVLARMLRKPGWARGKGHVRADGSEMDAEEIKRAWIDNGTVQSRRGTLLHWQIECHFSGHEVAEPHSPEFQMLLHFERAFMDSLGLVPWRVEMNLFHCGLRLAGQADLVCRDPGGKLVIIDWKRSREIRELTFSQERGTTPRADEMQRAPLAHLPNTNRYTYNLQLNTYRHMLETEYGLEVSGMYMVILHPSQDGPHVYEVPRMEAEIETLVRHIGEEKCIDASPRPGDGAVFSPDGLVFTRH